MSHQMQHQTLPINLLNLSVPIVDIIVLGATFCLPCAVWPHYLITDLGPQQHVCADESGFQVSRNKVIRTATKALKTNDSVCADAIYESNDAWQNLNLQFRDQKGAIINVDSKKASLIMGWC